MLVKFTKTPGRIVQLVLLLAVFTFITLFCIRNIYSYDYWWHIASGKWILENEIMHADPFSFTAKGAPLVDPYWLAQILLYSLGGAVVIFKAAVIAAAFAFCLLAAPREMRFSLPASALVLLGAFVAHERFMCRPEIFTLLFCAITLWVLFSLLERNRYSIIFIGGLTLLWVNLHPGWVLAPLLLCTFACGRLLGRWLGLSTSSKDLRRELLTFAAAGLCLIAAFGNPYFTQLVAYPFRLTLTTPHEISVFLEWVSPLPRLSSGIFTTELLHFKILVLALVGSFIINYRQFNFGHAAIAGFTFILSLTSYRHFGIFTLAAIPITLANLKPFWGGHFLSRLGNTKFKLMHLGATIAVIATSIYYCEETVTNRYYAKRELYSMSFGIGVSDSSFPTSALLRTDIDNGATRFFNSYELGGYVTYHVYPFCEVFLDGRLVHYPKQVYDDYMRVQANPEFWDSLVNKYDIHCAIIIHNLPRMQGLLKHIHNNPQWDLCRSHLNGVTAIYCRKDLNILFFPEEWEDKANTYPLFKSISMARFFVNVGEFQEAAGLLSPLTDKNPNNGKLYLYYGRALAGIGKLEEARTIFEKATKFMPESVEAHLNLGVAYWELGEKEKARKSWERVLEIEPQNEQALEYMHHGTQESK